MVAREANLFKPIQIGRATLQHRVAMAPLQRYRGTESHAASDLMREYFEQRACVPGTLLITEATYISAAAGGLPLAPGLWSKEHVEAWKRVTDAVHRKKCFIFCQIWGLGRSANPDYLRQTGYEYVSSSDVPLDGKPDPRPLSVHEISNYIAQFGEAAKLAMSAGFDGVEVHCAHGYLNDQFTQDVTNHRTDEYGGSIENRCRFSLETVRACVDAIGADRVACRISPWSTFQNMRMIDPRPTFSYLVQNLPTSLAYLHVVDPRIAGASDIPEDQLVASDSNDFVRELWSGKLLVAGGYTPESAARMTAEDDNLVVVMGRYFISNPDLIAKIKLGVGLRPYDRSTFYTHDARGYTDYPVDYDLVSKASNFTYGQCVKA